jgi:hypothetical protein
VRPLNRSVVFLQEKEVIISSNNWYVALGLSTRQYADTIATIRNDLNIIDTHHKQLTPIVELEMIKTSVDVLEARLREFSQLLPRL